MKITTLLASASVATLIAAGAASAADMAVKAPRMSAAPAAPAYSWTGCYAGAHVGWGWGKHDVTQSTTDISAESTVSASGGLDSSGGLFGGQLGCNYQFAPSWVIGLQGDISAADINGTADDPLRVFFSNSATVKGKTDWIASITGRLGVTAWNNQALFYVKGGGAWAHNRWDLGNSSLFFNTSTPAETRSGWTVGAGAEWAFAQNWSAFVDYSHYDFGSGGDVVTFNDDFTANKFSTGKQTIETVKLGVNYRFTGPMAP